MATTFGISPDKTLQLKGDGDHGDDDDGGNDSWLVTKMTLLISDNDDDAEDYEGDYNDGKLIV